MSRYCIHCGNKCNDDDLFCGACGKAIEDRGHLQRSAKSAEAKSYNATASSNTGAGKKAAKIIFGLIAVFFIFFISTFVIVVTNNASTRPLILLITAVISIIAFKKIVK